MNHNAVVLGLFTTLVVGFAGMARAELIDPAAPVQESAVQDPAVQDPIKIGRPLPLPRPKAQSHRISAERTTLSPPQPSCTLFCNNRYVLIVGIGF
jgi:hypothetical protein